MRTDRLKIAILGSGNIGTDLLVKVLRSPSLECTAFIGRRETSAGIHRARELRVTTSTAGISYLEAHPDSYDLVFDATTAADHKLHAPILEHLGKRVIDLTPAQVGFMCVPAVNLAECLNRDNLNMVTCGGQASIPLACAIAATQHDVEYIEVVSSIAAQSAGPATRCNLDEYIHTTENGLAQFTGVRKTKAIINLNPAIPCINMQSTIFAQVARPDMKSLSNAVNNVVKTIQKYLPGYQLVFGPSLDGERIAITVRVVGCGDYLPTYSGNLDIINCAAVAMAVKIAQAPANAPEGQHGSMGVHRDGQG